MKYKGPPVAAIFFMTSFNRDRGGGPWPPWPPPPGSAAERAFLLDFACNFEIRNNKFKLNRSKLAQDFTIHL